MAERNSRTDFPRLTKPRQHSIFLNIWTLSLLVCLCLGVFDTAFAQDGALLTAPGGITFSGSKPNFFTGFGTVNGLGVGTPMAGLTVIPTNGGVLYSTPYIISISGAGGGNKGVAKIFLSTNFAHPAALGVYSCPATLDCTNPSNYTAVPASQSAEITVIQPPGVLNGNLTEHLALFVSNTGNFSGTDSATIQWDFYAFDPSHSTLTLKHQDFLTLNRPLETVQAINSNLYVTNNADNTVSVVDPLSGKLVTTIQGFNGPLGVTGTPDGSKAYVTNSGPTPGTVSVINTGTNQITKTITVGSAPTGVDLSPDGQHLYVTNQNDGTLSIIATSTDTVSATIWVGGSPVGIAVTPDGGHAYIADFPSTVKVLDTSTNQVTATISDASLNGPTLVTISPDGATVYVSDEIGNAVTIIATATNTVTGSIPVGQIPLGLATTSDGKLLYVANGADNTVSVISTTSNSILATIAGLSGPEGLALSLDGKSIMVANTASNTISLIDISSNSITSSIAVGNMPTFIGLLATVK